MINTNCQITTKRYSTILPKIWTTKPALNSTPWWWWWCACARVLLCIAVSGSIIIYIILQTGRRKQCSSGRASLSLSIIYMLLPLLPILIGPPSTQQSICSSALLVPILSLPLSLNTPNQPATNNKLCLLIHRQLANKPTN